MHNICKPDDYQRFQELLPWYVNGTAAANDRAWVEAYLERDQTARQEVALEAEFADQFAQEIQALPANIGLAALKERLHRPAQQSSAAVPGRWQALWSRARRSLADWSRPQVGWALASVVPAGVIVLLLARTAPDAGEQYRSIGKPPPMTVVVQVRETVSERELRTLLLREGAEIVAGPSQLGEYRLIARNGDARALARTLVTSPIIESVSVDRTTGAQQ